MTEKILTLYFADDGTPFEENKDACKIYDELCRKYKNWLVRGLVKFWDGNEHYLNPELIDYTFADNLCYIDWLKKRLQYSYFIMIDAQPGDEQWETLWEFVSKFCPMSESECFKIERDYATGDLLAYDTDCRYHNFSFVARNTEEIYNRLTFNTKEAK